MKYCNFNVVDIRTHTQQTEAIIRANPKTLPVLFYMDIVYIDSTSCVYS